MNSVIITTVLIPGFVSVLLFLVFTYLHEQSRQPYFRAWKWAWAFYSLHYVLDTFPSSPFAFFVGELFLVAMALCIFVSTRLMRASYRFRWYDAAVGAAGVTLASLTLRGHMRERHLPARCPADHPARHGSGCSFCSIAPQSST